MLLLIWDRLNCLKGSDHIHFDSTAEIQTESTEEEDSKRNIESSQNIQERTNDIHSTSMFFEVQNVSTTVDISSDSPRLPNS